MNNIPVLSVKTKIRAGGILDSLCNCENSTNSSSSLPTFSPEDLAGFGLRFQPYGNQKPTKP